jgi:hypothetical protein
MQLKKISSKSVQLLSVLLCFLPTAAQDVSRPTKVNRQDVFLLPHEHFDVSGNWKAVFCQSEDKKNCMLAEISIEESKNSRETLADGKIVSVLIYPSRPGNSLLMVVKGLKAEAGQLSSVLSEDRQISKESVSLNWGGEKIQLHLERLNLVLEKMGTSAKQTVALFLDPEGRCKTIDERDLRLQVRLQWMGDLDRDKRPDFLIWASSYRSCASSLLRGPEQTNPERILILSSGAINGEFGRVVQPSNRPQP